MWCLFCIQTRLTSMISVLRSINGTSNFWPIYDELTHTLHMLNKCKLCRQQIPKGRWGQTLKPNLHGNLQVKIIYNIYNVTNCKILRTMWLVCLNFSRKIQVMLNTIRFRETESKKFRTTKSKKFRDLDSLMVIL